MAVRQSYVDEATVSAPAGLCGSCGMPMHWCFIGGEMMVMCDTCMDIFGMDTAGVDVHEGREAVMPDGRPIRSIERIVQNASINTDCEV